MKTNEYLNDVNDVYYNGGSQTTLWYVGLITATSFTGISANDTMASHAGWTEYTDYSETTRPVIDFGASSGGLSTNPVAVNFTPNANTELIGWFITSNSTKGSSTGKLPDLDTFVEGTQQVRAGNVEQFTFNTTAMQG